MTQCGRCGTVFDFAKDADSGPCMGESPRCRGPICSSCSTKGYRQTMCVGCWSDIDIVRRGYFRISELLKEFIDKEMAAREPPKSETT